MTRLNAKYIREPDGTIREARDPVEWAQWFETAENRHLRQDTVGDAMVSTVFLSLDHNFSEEGAPLLWETMVFGGKHDQSMCRYSSEESALRTHQAIAEALKAGRDLPEVWQ